MKRHLNLRKKANRYKAEAEALRNELHEAKKLMEGLVDGIRNPTAIAFEQRADDLFYFPALSDMGIPKFTLQCHWRWSCCRYVYSARLYYEEGERLDPRAKGFLAAMFYRMLEHWAGLGGQKGGEP